MPTVKTVAQFESALQKADTSQSENPYIVEIQFGLKKPAADRALIVVKLSNGALEVWDVG
jgi:hypothetical protein